MRRVGLFGALFFILAVIPTATAGGSNQVFPGCGETFKACVKATPPGGKIVLNTNKLLTVPRYLTIRKSLTIEAGDGFKPKIGRTTRPGKFSFEIKDRSARVVIRGIHFKGIGFGAQFKRGKHNTFQFVDNTVDLHTQSNGDIGVRVFLSGDARGSAVIRDNNISSSGNGIDTIMRGGSVSVIGNTVTSPVFEAGSIGIASYFAGRRLTTATVASNVIHDEAGCFCGSPTAMDFSAFDNASVKASILNNTIDEIGEPGTQGLGISIRADYDGPDAEMDIGLYNNIMTNSRRGIQIIANPQLTVTGNSNNTYQNSESDFTGGYDLGLTLHQDPFYRDAPNNNFRLKSNSSMAAGGTTCIPQRPLPRSDAANKFRLKNYFVDIGAYELGSHLPGSVPGRNTSGTESVDVMTGSNGVDILCGLGQNDELSGGKGADYIFGGIDSDVLRGGDGGDFVIGEEGADQVFGGNGPDFLDVFDGQGIDGANGQAGDDTCAFDAGDLLESCEH